MAQWLQRRLQRRAVLGAFLIPILLAAQPAGSDPEPGTVRAESKTGLEYVWIVPGTFQMGCVPDDRDCPTDELPRHRVTLSKGYWIGKTEVTRKAFQQFARKTRRPMPPGPKATQFRTLSGRANSISKEFRPGPGKKEDRPIVNVTWDEAAAFCKFFGGRLPTEAEWEYAARGGEQDRIYPNGSSISRDEANYGSVGGNDLWHYAAPVGSFPANAYGLHDMAGNVWEWCADWLDEDYYRNSPETDPRGPASGVARVARGGSWGFGPKYLRTSIRVRAAPGDRSEDMGFRCVMEKMP
jgi:formylglycine-generating enzyme required for sulfatase activity